ncbi:MAG: hypothetical protein HY279_02515 [Nitrospinae bacterium]|nr:hypothetical protein [Nitrospinota bacterium]
MKFKIFLLVINIFLLSLNFIAEAGIGDTYIEVFVTERPVYDKSFGETLIEVVSEKDGQLIESFELEGVWHEMGYAPEKKRYVLAGEFQTGAWSTLKELAYIDEEFVLKYSKAVPEHWMAFAAIPSSNLKYIAFVGQEDVTVLNVETDTLRVAGRSPAPPPVDKNLCWDGIKISGQAAVRWEWGNFCADGYTEMDKGIITFPSEDVLLISYGRDTYKKRAAKRTYKKINLKKLFQ